MEVMVDVSGDGKHSVNSNSSTNTCLSQKQIEKISRQFTHNTLNNTLQQHQQDEKATTSASFTIPNSVSLMSTTPLSQMMSPLNHYSQHMSQPTHNFLPHHSSSSVLTQSSVTSLNSVTTSNQNDSLRSTSSFNNIPNHGLTNQNSNIDTNITLWQFLYELLKSGEHFSLIQWTNNEGEFKVRIEIF